MRIVALSAHMDDSDFGCGATLHRLAAEGNEIFQVVFSRNAAAQSAGVSKDEIAEHMRECRLAWQFLGGNPLDVGINNYPARYFHQDRQEILDEMIRAKKTVNPDIVFLPASTDTHQDHQVVHNEGVRAFKNCSILGYEMPWNMTEFAPKCFWQVSEHAVAAKISALQCYKSQQHRPYMHPAFINSLAIVRGVQSGNPLAEAFEVVRWKQ